MANIILQHEGATYRTLGYTGRVTSPSLILEGGGQTLYTPLFAVASGAEGRDGNYYYKCCPLAVQAGGTTYRAAYARRYADSFSRTISGTIYHDGAAASVIGPYNIWSLDADLDVEEGSTADYTFNFDKPFFPGYFYVDEYKGCDILTYSEFGIQIRIFSHRLEVSTSGIPEKWANSVHVVLRVQGNTVTAGYVAENKSVTASGDFSYGHTYGSAPSLSADNGVSVSNNSGNASFHASKTLSGTVANPSSPVTLSQAFNVSFSGAA